MGGGPNGLTAAARLALAGADVRVFEARQTIGGASRSLDVFGNNSVVDAGAAAHPTGVISPAFRKLGLDRFGLEWIHPTYPMAHPFTNAESVFLHRDLHETLAQFTAADQKTWKWLHGPLIREPDKIASHVFQPLTGPPADLFWMAKFGARAVPSAWWLAQKLLEDDRARALFLGSAAHSMVSPHLPFTGAVGVLFGGLGMTSGWPVAKGGSQAIVNALAEVIDAAGGAIHTQRLVTDLADLPAADATVLNLTPKQVLQLRNVPLTALQRRSLVRWKYGSAASKVDFLLSGPVPWADPRTQEAGTVHLIGEPRNIVAAERAAFDGRRPHPPFIMVGQQQGADTDRVSGDGHFVLWTYAHVSHGESVPVARVIAREIERYAPGFTQRIIDHREMMPQQLQEWNPNLVGGDIGGGSLAGRQQFFRPLPSFTPYRLTKKRLYVASASAPPGGGVHGMAGWNAAGSLLKDFGELG